MRTPGEERLVERHVTFTLEREGRLYVIENVPARVDEETGEQYFSPSTLDRLHEIVRGRRPASRTIETPVFDFSDEVAA